MSEKRIFLVLALILLLQFHQCKLSSSTKNPKELNSDSSSSEESKEKLAKTSANTNSTNVVKRQRDETESSSSSSSSEESKEKMSNSESTTTGYKSKSQKLKDSKATKPQLTKTRADLLKFAMRELTELAYFTMIQGQKILKEVLKELSEITEKSVDLQERLKIFSAHVRRVESFEANPDNATPATIFLRLSQFSQIVEKYKSSTQTEPSAEFLLCKLTLQKYGLARFETDFAQNFMEFSTKFEKEIESYLTPLTEKQRTQEQPLINWFDEFKTEQNVDKKLNIAGKFFDLFGQN